MKRWALALLLLILPVLGLHSSGQAAQEPEILVSTDRLGQSWEIYALNPQTGALRNVSNHPADS